MANGSRRQAGGHAFDVVLVSMPFNVCVMPPIGICGLKSVLDAAGLRTRIRHFNLEFLPFFAPNLDVAQGLHDEISYLWDFLPGEWLFSPQGDGNADEVFLQALREAGVRAEILAILRELRPRTADFVERCAERLLADNPGVVGFTSSFMQNQASVCLARAIKRRLPVVKIVLGGSNAFGEMGGALAEQYPEIDVTVCGEAERTVVPLMRALLGANADALGAIPGICYRVDDGVVVTPDDKREIRMDEVPVPDFSDYFATLRELRRVNPGGRQLPQFLPIETSRGCWWGVRSHCTFCGLNADRMGFRSREPVAAYDYISEVRRRNGISRLFAVDNIIDHRYYATLLQRLADSGEPYFIHYEIKANLKRGHVDSLARAGVHKVQPGIESLSTPILKLMRKGITTLQNIQTLKWLTEAGIQVSWYLLYGFPGEEEGSYREMSTLLPKLHHITPPIELAPVYIERFSPYQMTPEAFGIEITGPTKWYRMAFPEVPPARLARMAYRFDFNDRHRDPALDAFVRQSLRPEVHAWKRSFGAHGPTLHLVHGPDESTLVLGSLASPERLIRVAGVLRRALINADAARLEQRLFEPPDEAAKALEVDARLYRHFLAVSPGLRDTRGLDTPLGEEEAVALLETRGLLLREGGAALALPLVCRASALENLLRIHAESLANVAS